MSCKTTVTCYDGFVYSHYLQTRQNRQSNIWYVICSFQSLANYISSKYGSSRNQFWYNQSIEHQITENKSHWLILVTMCKICGVERASSMCIWHVYDFCPITKTAVSPSRDYSIHCMLKAIKRIWLDHYLGQNVIANALLDIFVDKLVVFLYDGIRIWSRKLWYNPENNYYFITQHSI